MSSLHHDRLPEGGAAPTGTVDATPAPAPATGGAREEKAGSAVPPQRQGKARGTGTSRTTVPTTRTRGRAATVKAAGAKVVTAATRRAGGRYRATTPAQLTTARAAVLQVIAAKVAAAAAAEAPARRRPTPYKRSAVDLAALAPVTDVAALAEGAAPAAEAVVVVKDVVEPVVVVRDTPVAPGAEPAEVVAAVAAGRRSWLDRLPAAGRRRSSLYLAAALIGALSISGASVSGATEVATKTAGSSISVAEQLGIDASTAAPRVDADDTERLREVVASRNARDADRTAAADVQAEADRVAQEEADRAAAEAARPKAVLPVAGGRLTSGFGHRWGTLHGGIDLAAPMRTPEYAAADGVVLEAGPASGYGLVVYVQHDNGDVTVYGHMDEILVTPGQVVRAGDTIALLGNRGQSTGPHLHFEVRIGGIDGERVDPLPWLRERGVARGADRGHRRPGRRRAVGQWVRTTGRQRGIAVDHGHHSGMWVPDEPPTWGRMLLPHLDAWSVLAVLSIVGLVVYLAAVVRLRRTGVSWPWWRTLAWAGGTASLFAVTGTWFNGYSMVLFSIHMTQHMVLSLITPLLLLLGAPVTLALRTLPRGRGPAGAPRALLLEALHSRFARAVAHPLFTIPLFLASLYGVYFTPLFDALMSNPAGHQFMLAHFVVTGLLFFGPIVAQDPWPRTLGHPGRMMELFLPVPFHAFFGVAIMMAGSLVVDSFAQPPAGWGVDPLADQAVAGGIVWAFGELPTVLVLSVVFFSWARSDERRARTLDRAADRDGDTELTAYNARLRALAERQRA